MNRTRKRWAALVAASTIALSTPIIGLGLTTAPAVATNNATAAGSLVGQDFEAYLNAGETLNATFTVAAPGRADTAYETLWADVRTFRIRATAPDGQVHVESMPFTKGASAAANPSLSGSLTFAGLTSSTSGVWLIETEAVLADGSVAPIPSMAENAQGRNYASIEMASWNITPRTAGGAAISGRVWTDEYRAVQRQGDPAEDLRFFHLTDTGAVYQQDLLDFHGIYSYVASDQLGLANADCQPEYASSLVYTSDYPGTCDRNPNRVFFDRPDASMPQTATTHEGGTTWVMPDFVNPTVSAPVYTPDAASAHGGDIVVNLAGQDGTITIRIDTNGNGTFDDPVDVTLSELGTVGANTVQWDGRDGAGNPVSRSGDINFQASVSQLAEAHFLQFDVEVREGGVQYTQLTGPNVGDRSVSWDDRPLGTTCDQFNGDPAPCAGPIPANRSADRVDSTGGVHAWGNELEFYTWGDNRMIDEWVYVDASAESGVVAFAGTDPELRLVKNPLTEGPVAPGAKVTFEIAVSNVGSRVATDTVLTDVPVEGLVPDSIVIADPSAGTVEGTTWTIGDLAPGEEVTATVTGTVKAAPVDRVLNRATVTSPDDPYEPGEVCQVNDDLAGDTDQCDEAELPVEPVEPDLRINKIALEAEPISDDRIRVRWAVEATNSGKAGATETVVSDTYPDGVDVGTVTVTAKPTKGTFAAATGAWTIGDLAPDEVVRIEFEAEVDHDQADVVNTATITSKEDPYEPGEVCQVNDDLAGDTDQCDQVVTPVPNPAEPTPEDNGPNVPFLPNTGASALLLAGLVGALALLGGGGWLVLRRQPATAADGQATAPVTEQ